MSSEDESSIEMPKSWNGLAADEKWTNPKLAVESNKPVRPDQKNMISASEYLDSDEVLEAKVDLLARWLRESKRNVVYSGAGLSRGAGIPDYASKAKDSISSTVRELRNPLNARPTLAHCVIARLVESNIITDIVNQNHDGLAQKAGVPEQVVNEIHGAWFDPSNPVVQFNQSLRGDLFERLLLVEEEAQLCVCVGTSLSGMNADRVVESTAKRYIKQQQHGASKKKNAVRQFGSIIINLQRTRLDGLASLRIWAPSDRVFTMLAAKMGVPMSPVRPLTHSVVTRRTLCRYNAAGEPMDDKDDRLMLLDFEAGSRIVCGSPDDTQARYRHGRIEDVGQNKIFQGDHDEADGVAPEDGVFYETGNVYVTLEGAQGKLARPAVLGGWWMHEARLGRCIKLPLRNETPVFVHKNDSLCTLRYTCTALENGNNNNNNNNNDNKYWKWSLDVVSPKDVILPVSRVTYQLHPTFNPATVVRQGQEDFRIERTGWGTFSVGVTIEFCDGSKVETSFPLDFTKTQHDVPITVAMRKN